MVVYLSNTGWPAGPQAQALSTHDPATMLGINEEEYTMHIHEFAGRKTVNMSNGTASIKLTSDEVQGEERLVMNAQAFVKRDASVKVNPNTKNTVSISFTRDDDEGWVQIVLDRDLAAEMVRQLAGDHGIV